MPRDNRDDQLPKSGPLHKRPQSVPAIELRPLVMPSTAVPAAIYEQEVTGRFDTTEAEHEARFQRDVMRTLRALSLKIAAGNKVFRDAFRRQDAEREKRSNRDLERAKLAEEMRQRRDKTLRFVVTRLVPLLAAIGGLVKALKG